MEDKIKFPKASKLKSRLLSNDIVEYNTKEFYDKLEEVSNSIKDNLFKEFIYTGVTKDE